MSDAANFTEQEQWELDKEDPVQALWRLENEARARWRALDQTGADYGA